MSAKKDLTRLLREYGEKYSELENKILSIKGDRTLSAEGKSFKIKQLTDSFVNTANVYNEKAKGLIDGSLNAMTKKRAASTTGKLSDPAYQAGLANVIKMMEYGAINTEADLGRIIETYKGDTYSMGMFRGILEKNGSALQHMIPEDKLGENIDYLNQLKGNVDKYITYKNEFSSVETWNRDPARIGAAMMGMSENIETSLDNGLGFAADGGAE